MAVPKSEWFKWPIEAVDQLKALFAGGLSAGQIAIEMNIGVSRNAIIGKISRLGLQRASRAPFIRKPQAPRTPGPSKPKPRKITDYAKDTSLATRAIARKQRAEQDPTEIIDLLPDSDIPIAQRRTIVTITDDTCHWPVGTPGADDFFFCGAVTASRPYCTAHCHRAYDKVRTHQSVREARERAATFKLGLVPKVAGVLHADKPIRF